MCNRLCTLFERRRYCLTQFAGCMEIADYGGNELNCSRFADKYLRIFLGGFAMGYRACGKLQNHHWSFMCPLSSEKSLLFRLRHLIVFLCGFSKPFISFCLCSLCRIYVRISTLNGPSSSGRKSLKYKQLLPFLLSAWYSKFKQNQDSLFRKTKDSSNSLLPKWMNLYVTRTKTMFSPKYFYIPFY